MSLRCLYSAISYAAVVLTLSGQVAAAPAEVSGANRHNNLTMQEATGTNIYSASHLFAYNLQQARIPTYTVTAAATAKSVDSSYDTNLQDALEQKMRVELDKLIEFRGF